VTQGPALLGKEARRDIQGFVTSGYGHLPVAAYLFVRVADPASGRRWIGALVDAVTTAAPWPRDAGGATVKPATTMNVAFTAAGLQACGLPAAVLCSFAPEFREGMASDARSRILGDTEESAPGVWELGGPGTEPVHAVLIVHAADETSLDGACEAERLRLVRTDGGVVELENSAQRGYRPRTDTEPFGFRDGITQPTIAGLAGHGVPTGEFILGYPNHYDVIPPPPVVPAALDPDGILPPIGNPYHDARDWRDLGRHGTYVVYRKLQQDVAAFWRTLRDESVRQRGGPDTGHMIWLASKMVGRWPGGAPLVTAPQGDDSAREAGDDFEYGSDPEGLACPIGAHIRRTHPRDGLKPYPAEQSRHMSEAHRLLRRGRIFGPPLFDPTVLRAASPAGRDVLLTLEDDGQPRGVHFFCVNASIQSQFEFVQQTWCNNPRFGGLSTNKDPIAGDHGRAGDLPTRMVIPTPAGPTRTGPLPRFVTVRGGAYLFMPGLTALRFLAGGSDPARSR
jgi:deferrochelatase/peroxidase EfeB